MTHCENAENALLTTVKASTSPRNCCLMLVVPAELEDEIVDTLIQNSTTMHAFFSDQEEGHNMAWEQLNHAERVLGRKKCVHFKILLSQTHATDLIILLKTHFAKKGITYWLHNIETVGMI